MKRIIITLGAVLLAAQAHAQTSRTVIPPAPKPAATYDSAFGAYQRGYFLTAFKEASELAARNDPQSLTLLAELYANGLGVGRDDVKAAELYQRAATLNDPQAMFALAIFRFQGRGGVARRKGRRGAVRAGGQARQHNRRLQPRPHLSRGPALSARRQARRRAVHARRAERSSGVRNTRSPRSTRKARACRRTSARRRA